MRSIEDFLEIATQRILTDSELEEFCALCTESERNQVLIRLMKSGTAAARENLRSAKGLKAGHEATKALETVRKVKQFRKDQKAGTKRTFRQTQASGLPFGVTDHAFERFVDRHMHEEVGAYEKLLEEARQACPIRKKTFAGDEQWVSPSGIVFVVHRDTNPSALVCVTILPKRGDCQYHYGKPR